MGALELTVVEPCALPRAALIVAWPTPLAVTNPVELTEATLGSLLAHFAELVTSRLEPSEKKPIADICWV